jgi:hypothetical protein
MIRVRRLLLATGSAIAGIGTAAAFLAAMSIGHHSASAAPMGSAESVIDQTYSCASAVVGGLRQIEVRAHAGIRAGSGWSKMSYAVIASGGGGRTADADVPPESSVVWIAAGTPSPTTTLDDERLSFNARVGGTVGVNRDRCTPVSRRLPLTRRGLVGGAAGTRTAAFDCEATWRVLVRVLAFVDGGTELRRRGRVFRATGAAARLARFSVATPTGRLIAYAEVFDSGKARLFTARACTPE